jgi:hypothetical protein
MRKERRVSVENLEFRSIRTVVLAPANEHRVDERDAIFLEFGDSGLAF